MGKETTLKVGKKTIRSTTQRQKTISNKSNRISPFASRVYAFCKRIPVGSVCSYKAIAQCLGNPLASRAVGAALRSNPFAPRVPCHRVCGSNGRLTGFMGNSNIESTEMQKKTAMLRAEGVKFLSIDHKHAQIVHPESFVDASVLSKEALRPDELENGDAVVNEV